ncbi:hypothetical protein [Gallibacterium anatis]|uniref:hypothetical protein n=1 Tax=Gallibacterium anatis TaxID=750 RepID=UPI00266EACAB|nr:hypothetical protein [Gallibacterium anatis]WKS98289.1 hypothetical protein NYR19_05860 [Gallibacterium anatis]
MPNGDKFLFFQKIKQQGVEEKMRLPNGYGSVFKLSGKRRKPFIARKTIGYNENKRQIYHNIGYFATKEDALKALSTLILPMKELFIGVRYA